MPFRPRHCRARARRACEALSALALSTLLALPALAQDSATGVLAGRATDASGAALVGARVVATRTATASVRETTTDAAGRFTLVNLAPGTYQVEFSAPGFAAKKLERVVVEVGRRVPVDAVLDLGGRPESVTVDERAVAVPTGGSLVGGVVSSSVVESLPLNGRNFLELALLMPGNAPAPNFDPTKANTFALSSAGQLGRGGNITIDGQDNNDDVVGGPLANLPQDAVQEFQIATNRFSAEQGRSAAAAVNVVTRGGSDTLSGSATVLVRDDSLQGLPATYDRSSGEAPPFSRKQYSAALGGPIVRGRAWWFAAAEYRNQDAVVQVGERDTAARTIRRRLAEAPLDDLLATGRVDLRASGADTLSLRYLFEDQDDTAASALDRAIGSASQRQASTNRHHQGLLTWTRTLGPVAVNVLRASYSDFRNAIDPVSPGRQLTFPSLQDGASFRVPQATTQSRWQVSDSFSWAKGAHTLRLGGDFARTAGRFDLGVFRDGRVELVQDFPQIDLDGNGRLDDEDLLFAVTLRSGKPDQDLVLDGCDSTYLAAFVQDDWRVTPQLTLNVGLRWEVDTNVKNISGYSDINPIVRPFLQGDRGRDLDNFGPRLGLAWTNKGGSLQVHGGWGLYYDRVTLEVMSLERGLDGRALPIEVRAGNAFFLDAATGTVPPFAPTFSNPFTGFVLPGAGASGINIIDNTLENPTVQQLSLGTRFRVPGDAVLALDYVHNRGTHFIIGRTVGEAFNPVVGGPDRVVNLESSVGTRYDALLASLEKRWGGGQQVRASYTLARARNYSNDDQIPFGSGPIDPNDLEREYGPTPNEQRHRIVLSGSFVLPLDLRVSGIWTIASAVPMDILMPDASTRVPAFSRNAGGREFRTAADLNAALTSLNAAGGANGQLLPLVGDDARFGDGFDSLDLRLARAFRVSPSFSLEAIVECFNVFNATNVLGVSKSNYSGFANVLARDSSDPAEPGYLRSSSFGRALTTAGGVFGSGGPRAFQLGLRARF
ncbi:MAG TPA: TonB-dependent receptor [Vicinamibacteria bacterium]|nr:TonB-dependent receptor [Vicinamibacteria bacterium]